MGKKKKIEIKIKEKLSYFVPALVLEDLNLNQRFYKRFLILLTGLINTENYFIEDSNDAKMVRELNINLQRRFKVKNLYRLLEKLCEYPKIVEYLRFLLDDLFLNTELKSA